MNEKKIINFIRYIPVIIITLLSIIITSVVFSNKIKEHDKKIDELQNEYIQKSNQTIKNEVNKIYNYIEYKKRTSEEELKKELREKTLEISKVIKYTFNKYKNTHNKAQMKDKIKDILKEYRFNENRGYFYMPNLKGENEIHPLFPELEGKSGLHLKDLKGNFFVKDVMEELKNKDEVFYEFYWKRPETKDKELKKITFNKKLNIYDWYIGTGEYVDIFEKGIKKEILDYVNNKNYGFDGSFFIIDLNKNILAHKNQDIIGLNQKDIDNMYIKNVLDIILSAHKEDKNYFKHISSLTNDENGIINSICFIKHFEHWDWIVGTTYDTKKLKDKIEDLTKKTNQNNNKELKELIILSIILIMFSIILFYLFSRRLEKLFKKYKKDVDKKNKENRKKDSILAQQSKMASMGEMLENIAHQWKQPLSVINTVSTATSFKAENNILENEELLTNMEQISTSTKYLSTTIDDFRNFFKKNKEPNDFNIKDTISKTTSLLKSQLISKKITLFRDIDNLEFHSFENELIQVLINVINNAKDELVKNEIDEKLIFINVKEKDEENILISIKDNAGGIKEEYLEKVFDAYFTTKEDQKGTGIGLYMSKEIVEKHLKGEIKASNEVFTYNDKEYKGAIFTLTIKQSL